MTAKVISVSIHKGGCGKTLTTGSLAYLLSKMGKKVLVIDADSQGSCVELLCQCDIYSVGTKIVVNKNGEKVRERYTLLEALKEQNVKPYIKNVAENLDIIPVDDHLATFPKWLWTEYQGRGNEKNLVFKKSIKPILNDYDYILIDTPPHLSETTINAIACSDGIIVMFETSKFCYSALDRFNETIQEAQKHLNPNLKIIGILPSMIDSRRQDNKALLELVQEEYGDLVFKTIIHRRASTARLPINGYFDNAEVKIATEEYAEVVKELIERGW